MVALVLATGVCFAPTDARAGGGNWSFDRPSYEPGDVVVASTVASWGHNPELGTPDDGPYGVWIMEEPAFEAEPRSLADSVEVARYVTDVAYTTPLEINGERSGGAQVRATFVLPDVPPGFYLLLHCNYPCTTYLGDINGRGGFWVGPPDPFRQPTSGHAATSPRASTIAPTTAAPTTTASTTVHELGVARATRPATADSSRSTTVPLVAGGAVALLAVGGSVRFARRRRPAPHPE